VPKHETDKKKRDAKNVKTTEQTLFLLGFVLGRHALLRGRVKTRHRELEKLKNNAIFFCKLLQNYGKSGVN